MSWSDNLVFALIYVDKHMGKHARLMIAEDLVKYLPQVVDAQKDLEKPLTQLFTKENLALNPLRIADLQLYTINDQEGAAVCNFKAVRNFIRSLAKLLHNTNPQLIAKFLDLIADINIPNANEISEDEKPGWFKVGKGFATNIKIFRSIHKLWKTEDMQSDDRIGAVNDIYESWLILSGNDFITLQKDMHHLFKHLQILLEPLQPFLNELELAIHAKPGTIAKLLGLSKTQAEQDQDDEEKLAKFEKKSLQLVDILLKIETDQYFDEPAVFGLKMASQKFNKVHEKIVKVLTTQFDDEVVYTYQQVDDQGFYTLDGEGSPATTEMKELLNSLKECALILDKIDQSKQPVLTLIGCVKRLYRLYQHACAINARDFVQHYIERINQCIRDALVILSPVMALMLCELERFELMYCLRPGYFEEKLTLNEICATFCYMCAEIGASVDELPPFPGRLKQFYDLESAENERKKIKTAKLYKEFEKYHERLTGQQTELVNKITIRGKQKREKQYSRAYIALEHFPLSDLRGIKKALEDSELDPQVTKSYLDELSAIINSIADDAGEGNVENEHGQIFYKNRRSYPPHQALDALVEITKRKLFQMYTLHLQREKHIQARIERVEKMQAIFIKSHWEVGREVFKRRIDISERQHLLALLQRSKSYIKHQQWAIVSTSQRGRIVANTPDKTLKKVIALISDNPTMAWAREKCQQLEVLLETALFEQRAADKKSGRAAQRVAKVKPKKRAQEVHDFLHDVLKNLIKIHRNTLPRVAGVNDVFANPPTELRPLANHDETNADAVEQAVDVAIGLAAVATSRDDDDLELLPSLKEQVQSLLLYSHAYLSHYAKNHLRPICANSYQQPNDWVKVNVLAKSPLQFIRHADQILLTKACVEMQTVNVVDGHDEVVNSLKATTNISLIGARVVSTLNQQSIDDILRSINVAVGVAENDKASTKDIIKTVPAEVYNALRILTLYLNNGWRDQLKAISRNLVHIGDFAWEKIYKHFREFADSEELTRARSHFVGRTKAFAIDLHFKIGLVDELRAQYLDLFKEGVNYKTNKLVVPACKFTLWGTQQLAEIELGSVITPLQQTWSKSAMSESVHQAFTTSRNLIRKLAKILFKESVFDLYDKELPYPLEDDTPLPLREVQVYMNIVHYVDLLIRELNKDKSLPKRVHKSRKPIDEVKRLTPEIKYQQAVKALVVLLQDYIRDILPLLKPVLTKTKEVCTKFEDDLILLPNKISQKIHLDRMIALYEQVVSLYEAEAVDSPDKPASPPESHKRKLHH